MTDSLPLAFIAAAMVAIVLLLSKVLPEIAQALKSINGQLAALNENQRELRSSISSLSTHILHAGEGRRELLGDIHGLPGARIDVRGNRID